MTGAEALPELPLPEAAIVLEPRYVLGLPLVAALTLACNAPDTEFYRLPFASLLAAPGALGLTLQPVAGGPPVRKPFMRGEQEPEVALGTGEQRTMLMDLSNFGLALVPGAYRLTVELRVSTGTYTSPPADLELVAPSDSEAIEARRLRRLGHTSYDAGAWEPFLTANWHTVRVEAPLSPDAARQLAPYLFLHRAWYGPDVVAMLDPAVGAAARQRPVWAGETALWALEILLARGDASASATARSEIVAAWPGLAARVAEIERGDGLLATGRRCYGAESAAAPASHARPYRGEP